MITLENEIYSEIKTKLFDSISRIRAAAENIALLDTFASLAEVAQKNSYTCPEIIPSGVVDIENGRHPVSRKWLKMKSLFRIILFSTPLPI